MRELGTKISGNKYPLLLRFDGDEALTPVQLMHGRGHSY